MIRGKPPPFPHGKEGEDVCGMETGTPTPNGFQAMRWQRRIRNAPGAMFLTGCCMQGGPVSTVAITGGITSEHRAPGAFNIDNSVKCAKCGTAKSKGIVLYTTGDSSIKAAMDAGGITKVHHVDFESTNIFNVYTEATTIVWGE